MYLRKIIKGKLKLTDSLSYRSYWHNHLIYLNGILDWLI